MLFFCLFQCFEEKEYQTKSKRNETFRSDLFGTNAIQETWSGCQGANEAAVGVKTGGSRVGGPDLLFALIFLGYMGIYRRKKSVGGATRAPREWRARPLSLGLLEVSLACTPSPLDCFRSKNNAPEGFILFFKTLK